jgi:hypothetical protein
MKVRYYDRRFQVATASAHELFFLYRLRYLVMPLGAPWAPIP